MGYFARRCRDPHTVADLTSETFVRGIDGFARSDPRRGSDRAWRGSSRTEERTDGHREPPRPVSP
jgi:DNA-directed RNA polymerase specialized sigma24 family protein